MRCLEILVMNPNPGEASLLVEAFLQKHCTARVTVTHDGEEVLQTFSDRDYRPDLVVFDLDLLDGSQILTKVRRKIGAKVPVIVMSSSRNPEDISEAYASGANVYMAKPAEQEGFRKLLQCLTQLWIEPLKQA